jgi:hypothetical protein
MHIPDKRFPAMQTDVKRRCTCIDAIVKMPHTLTLAIRAINFFALPAHTHAETPTQFFATAEPQSLSASCLLGDASSRNNRSAQCLGNLSEGQKAYPLAGSRKLGQWPVQTRAHPLWMLWVRGRGKKHRLPTKPEFVSVCKNNSVSIREVRVVVTPNMPRFAIRL